VHLYCSIYPHRPLSALYGATGAIDYNLWVKMGENVAQRWNNGGVENELGGEHGNIESGDPETIQCSPQ
tara:strand:+ start:886 stop:1092 length:207 start_codon:yes stop_codon:yes gene_type:complete